MIYHEITDNLYLMYLMYFKSDYEDNFFFGFVAVCSMLISDFYTT